MSSEQEERELRKRKKRAMLKMFYGGAPSTPAVRSEGGDPMDIDGGGFESDHYLKKIYSALPLGELVTKEKKLGSQIKSLDSEMQTLVYENYNKFISATDTIRKMKSQVDGMEEEMSRLVENMTSISSLSGVITETLAERRERIRKLSDSHSLLKKLQFLFELPKRLKKCLESFKGIYDECTSIMARLKGLINEKIETPGLSQIDLVSNLEMLTKLHADPDTLCTKMLGFARVQFEADRAEQEAKLLADIENAAAAAAAAAATPTKDGAAEYAGVEDAQADAASTKEAGAADDEDDAARADLFGPTPRKKETKAAARDEKDGAAGAEGGGADGDEDGGATFPLAMFMARGNSTVLSNLVEWLVSYEETFIAPGKDIEESAMHPEKQRLRSVCLIARKHMAAFAEELGA
eukprot:gene15219-27696_t